MVTAATVGHDEVVFFMGAYYHDDLRKTPDGWRICRRRAERVYIHNFPGAYDPKSVPANR